jgi:MFS family permease
VDSEYIQDELAEIVVNHEYEQSVIPQTSYIGGWINCFSGSISDGSSNLRRSILGIMMQMMQQLTGINFIFYFGNVFFTSLGTILNPFLISILTALVNTVCTPVAFWAVDKIGRRSLLIWGAVGMIVSQLIVGIIGVTAGRLEKHNNSAVSAMIAFICFNIAFFSVTWGPVAWVVVGEVFPILSVGLQGSCILFCILTPNYDRLAHRRLFSLTRLLFSYLSLTRALFSLLRIHLRILGSLSLGNYRSRAP